MKCWPVNGRSKADGFPSVQRIADPRQLGMRRLVGAKCCLSC
jgi:hypothetical protein